MTRSPCRCAAPPEGSVARPISTPHRPVPAPPRLPCHAPGPRVPDTPGGRANREPAGSGIRGSPFHAQIDGVAAYRASKLRSDRGFHYWGAYLTDAPIRFTPVATTCRV